MVWLRRLNAFYAALRTYVRSRSRYPHCIAARIPSPTLQKPKTHYQGSGKTRHLLRTARERVITSEDILPTTIEMAHTPPQFRRMLSVFQGLQPPICDRSDSSPLDNLTQTPTATRLSQIFAALPCPPAMDQRLDLNSAPFSLENQLQGTRAEDALDWSELASEGCSRSREPSLPASLSVGVNAGCQVFVAT